MNKKITFFEIEKRQRFLLIVFLILISLGLLVWFGYFKPSSFAFLFPKVEFSYPRIEEIKIKMDLFDNPILKNLEPFPQIEAPTSSEIGKENPFLPSFEITTSTATST